ncbi:MAG: hypothetical protein HN932_13315 [Candidatus Marinimicrobia bacterium]|jgi:hypothetical protein|nr:hypothetical protein [Candidatus Neomarinimicrobiota bacterium]MBT5269272.1 hypothetical protein [Candidatus Neomarinimicrobiota bacterium]MBT7091442.1 hypothetical protein [Candidatus Neomarinimicrobiota bacterium]
MKKKVFVFVGVISALVLAQLACSLPWEQSLSEVEEEPSAQQPSVEQSPTPNPEESQTGNQPSDFCKETLAANVNIADGQTFAPDESFQVIWTIENTGECAWSADYALKLMGGDINAAKSLLPLGTPIAPGGTVTLGVDMQAPSQAGNYVSAWKMQNAQGREFGQGEPPNSPLRVAIKVLSSGQGNQGGNPTPVPPTLQPVPVALIQSQGEQVTMLTDECYDLHNGGVIDCSEPYAIFTYHQTTKKSLQVMEIKGQDSSVKFAAAVSTEPTKADCEAAIGSGSTVIWPLNDTSYYCYAYTPGMVTYVGWLRPTAHNTNGMTFDYRTWKATP